MSGLTKTDVVPMRIGADRVVTDDTIEVRSPYDDRLLATVPRGTTEHIDAAVAVALERHRAGALPAGTTMASTASGSVKPVR